MSQATSTETHGLEVGAHFKHLLGIRVNAPEDAGAAQRPKLKVLQDYSDEPLLLSDAQRMHQGLQCPVLMLA